MPFDERTTPIDLVRGKGHVPCLRARPGGVLVRAGHTEGSVDLARMAQASEEAGFLPSKVVGAAS